jgi:hypothetical protein
MKTKEMERVARSVLDKAPWVIDCELVRRRGHLEVNYLDQTFFLFSKKEEFWFENEGGNASFPLSDCKSTFISLLVFAFECKLRATQ